MTIEDLIVKYSNELDKVREDYNELFRSSMSINDDVWINMAKNDDVWMSEERRLNSLIHTLIDVVSDLKKLREEQS